MDATAAVAAVAPTAAADQRHKGRCMWKGWSAQRRVEGCSGSDWGSGRAWAPWLAVVPLAVAGAAPGGTDWPAAGRVMERGEQARERAGLVTEPDTGGRASAGIGSADWPWGRGVRWRGCRTTDSTVACTAALTTGPTAVARRMAVAATAVASSPSRRTRRDAAARTILCRRARRA